MQLYKLLNFFLATRGKCMDSETIFPKKLARLKKEIADEDTSAVKGQLREELVSHARKRIVLLPCGPGCAMTKANVVDVFCKDAFQDSFAGKLVVLQHVNDRTGECVLFGLGVVVEKALLNDMGLCAFERAEDSAVLLPVMVLAIFDANPIGFAGSGGAYDGAFAGSAMDPVKLGILVSQGRTATQMALPPELAPWISRDALDAARGNNGGAAALALEARRAILLRALARRYLDADPRKPTEVSLLQPVLDIFDGPPATAAVGVAQCFPVDAGGKKRKAGKEIVEAMKRAHTQRRLYVWGGCTAPVQIL